MLEEVSYICVVFELTVDSLPSAFIFLNLFICFHRVPVRLARVALKPLLELNVERERLAELRLEESPVLLGAY